VIGIDPNARLPWPGWTWCRVCGVRTMENVNAPAEHGRCYKHKNRNPCIVEGCQRTAKAPERIIDGVRRWELSCDQTICATHWRSFVPPGSPERRIYLRFFRRAKRYGWTEASSNAFYRFWDSLVSRVRAKARGDLDPAEINRIMGW
jgi:hypothetical protein